MKPLDSGLQGLRARALACALAASAGALWALDANSPQAYALRLPITLAPDAPLQRLLLPAQALVNLQSAGYSDLRIFNAQGQPVPMALANAPAASQSERQQVKLAAYPILGADHSTSMGGMDGLQLRIEERQGKRVVQLSSASAPGAGSSTGAAPIQKILGALLDAREVKTPLVSIALDVDLPSAQPITFNLQASKDLKTWRQLADTVLFRAEGTGASLGSATLSLPATDIKDHYLRITWADSAAQLAAVTLRGATLTTSRDTTVNARVTATIATPTLLGPHEFSFALPFATPLAALRIAPSGSNVLVPVRVLGRNDRSQPWTLLASAVVYKLAAGGKEQSSGAVELQGATFREIKIEADKKTPGFAAPPEVALQFEPTQIVFLASGTAPFTLAVGLGNSPSAYLPLQSLMPLYQVAQENTLPLARAEVPGASAALVAAPPALDTVPTRSLVLWGVLLLGALGLALMAWVLLKQTKKPPLQDI